MTMSLRAFLSVLCLDCNSVCRLCCDKSWRVCHGHHKQSLNHVIRFRVKIVFVVMEIFVLYSGKSDLLLAFSQRHGVILSEILGKGGCRGEAPT